MTTTSNDIRPATATSLQVTIDSLSTTISRLADIQSKVGDAITAVQIESDGLKFDIDNITKDLAANPVPASPIPVVVIPPPTPAPAPTTNMKPGDWLDRYGVANSGGTFKFDDTGLTFGPKPIGASSLTAAGLAIFKPAGAVKAFTNMTAEVEFTLVKQLRTPNGNLWECFWLFTNYADNADLTKTTNAFVFKSNHLQIETCSGHVQETWLYEGGTGCLVGVRQKVKVQIIGQTMTVWINGAQVLSKTLNGAPCTSVKDDGRTLTTAPGYLYSNPGSIGLYCEDALITVHNCTVTAV